MKLQWRLYVKLGQKGSSRWTNSAGGKDRKVESVLRCLYGLFYHRSLASPEVTDEEPTIMYYRGTNSALRLPPPNLTKSE